MIEALARGIRLHNQGAFFEAHEVFEDLWRASTDERERRLYQGLVQITAAFHKLLVMGNPASARNLLDRGVAKLEGLPADFGGVDLEKLLRDVARAADRLSAGTLQRREVPSITAAC